MTSKALDYLITSSWRAKNFSIWSLEDNNYPRYVIETLNNVYKVIPIFHDNANWFLVEEKYNNSKSCIRKYRENYSCDNEISNVGPFVSIISYVMNNNTLFLSADNKGIVIVYDFEKFKKINEYNIEPNFYFASIVTIYSQHYLVTSTVRRN